MDTTKKRHTDNKEADILHAAEREFLSKDMQEPAQRR